MKFRLENKIVQYNSDFELPDFAFNHAYVPAGNEVRVMYLVPVDDTARLQVQKSEILAHLLGEYK